MFAIIAKFGDIEVVFVHSRTGFRETRKAKEEVRVKAREVRPQIVWKVHLI